MTAPNPSPTHHQLRRRTQIVFLFGAIAVLTVALLVGYRLTHHAVTINVGGHVRELYTQSDTVADVLADADVYLDPEDVVEPALSASVTEGLTITVHRAAVVVIEADGEVVRVRTQLTEPLAILNAQSITVAPTDRIRVDGHDYTSSAITAQTWDAAPISIRVLRGTRITVLDEGRALVWYTTQTNVGRALDDAGLDLFLADQVEPNFAAPIRENMTITIARSTPVTLVADGQTLNTRSPGQTVADALAAAQLAPLGPDYTIPDLDTPLEAGMRIEVIRVEEEIITEPVPLTASDTPEANSPVWLRSVRVRTENGVEVSRTVEAEWLAETAPPANEPAGTLAR